MNKKTPTARQPKGIPVGGQFAAKSLGEADVILAEAHTAARRAVEKAYEAGIAEGQRRQRGEPHRTLAEVMDLSTFTFDDALADPTVLDDDPTVLDDFGGIDMSNPWTITENTPVTSTAAPAAANVECFSCNGTGFFKEWRRTRHVEVTCPSCNGTLLLPATPSGRDEVDVPGYGTFHRRRDGVYPDFPGAMRFEANRDLTDEEARRVAQLVGYRYAATVAGEPLGWPDRDSPRSICVSADSTKTRRDDVNQAFEEFEDDLDAFLVEGSPVRTTNRAGAGTKGTRLVEGLGDPDLKIQVYYDTVDVEQAVGAPS